MEYKIEVNNEIKSVQVNDKQVLLMLKGCPASGKSTFAEKLFQISKEHDGNFETNKNKFVIVCRDDIRAELGIKQRDYSRESEVTKIEVSRANEILDMGYSLIVADTNLNPKTQRFWHKFADDHNCEFQEIEFYVPYEEAVARDKERERKVGWKGIEAFYKAYYRDRFREEMRDKRIINEDYDFSMKDCVICDLDGTLAIHQGRSPYDWKELNTDKIDIRLVRVLEMYYKNGVEIILLTGRPEYTRDDTKKWLDKNLGDVFDYQLLMRETSDYRKGPETKKEIYDELMSKYKYNVLCVFEDSDRCVDMWRSLGLLTCQMAKGVK